MTQSSILDRHGALSTRGNRIVDAAGQPFVLRGMSLFWSQWIGKYYTPSVLAWLRDDWKVNAVRAAMAVNYGGYRQDPKSEYEKLTTVIDAAIALGIYVIADWHAHELETDSACAFFERLSRQYRDVPNLIYEIWNEPYPKYKWANDIKPFHDAIIPCIRANAPKCLIVVGSETYSQRVDVSAASPLEWDNIAYSIHFYASTHKRGLRNNCKIALEKGLPLLVTEYGTCESSGDGVLNREETARWWNFLRRHDIGHFNWSIADKIETAAALHPGASTQGGWDDTDLTPSGKLVRSYLRLQASRDGELVLE